MPTGASALAWPWPAVSPGSAPNWSTSFLVERSSARKRLSRFFALHVFVLPGALFGLIGLHLLLVIKCGINETPTPGYHVNKKTYFETYEREVKKRGMPFFPNAAARDMIAVSITLFLVVLFAALFGPSGPTGMPDPTLIDTAPEPDFWFMSIFAVLALLPPYMETFLIIGFPVLAAAVLILLPFISGRREALEKKALLGAGRHLPDAHAWLLSYLAYIRRGRRS